MSGKLITGRLPRRRFLQRLGQGALVASLAGSHRSWAVPADDLDPLALCGLGASPCELRLVATDGHFSFPGRSGEPDPVGRTGAVYGFGFVRADAQSSIGKAISKHKGHVQWPAPTIAIDESRTLHVRLINAGLKVRIDLADSHTIHWHGFRNPLSLFDGVPEMSIAVPPSREFTYFYAARQPGTYMYHCHFEDVEHVQMGMQGNIYVRPNQNQELVSGLARSRLGGNPAAPVQGYAYNDGVADNDPRSTAYDREYAMLLNELWTLAHDNLESVQENNWNDYYPNYYLINGRSYPDTVKSSDDPSMAVDDGTTAEPTVRQPISSLVQCLEGERVLLRFANLGYQQHAMQLAGIPMRVIGHDATLLRGPAPTFADTSYATNTVYLGPGEARDVLFTAPPYDGLRAMSDSLGSHNVYMLMNRDAHKLSNNGDPSLANLANGIGGMATEVRVYAPGTPLTTPQATPNATDLPLV
jgi:FtsP/CotA-like multicopper oxidase with cupredoxin domain